MAHYIEQEVYTSSEESGGEDSDEDIITDYLSPLDDNGNLDAAATSSSSPGAVNASAILHFYNTTESSSSSLRISAEDMEPAGAASSSAGEATDESNYVTTAAAAAESIPIISVTQHSPAASKAFFILEDNLRQLHGIQESIQRMRQVSVQTLRLQSQVGRRLRYGGVGASCNWSLSCPSLSGGQGGVASSSSGLAGNGNGNNNETDWLGATLADWDSPTPPGMAAHYWVGGVGGGGSSHKGGIANGSKRRRSWASPWEVDEMGLASAGGTCGITYHEEAGGGGALDGVGGSGRTRSISLSSGDTDNEQDATVAGGGHSSRARQAGITTSSSALSSGELKVLAGRHSTHSLNDMGFPLIPALPTKPRGLSKDGSGVGGDATKWLSPRILTLQKSISTPSILAVKDGSNLTALSIKNNSTCSSSASGASASTMAATLGSASVGASATAKETQGGILMTATAAGPTSSFPRMSSYTGLESETDDDSELHLNHHHHHHHLSHDHVSSRYSLGSFVAEPGFENDDDANSSKRRKRGSIFFRKRKDKDKEKEKSKLKQPHQFVPVCHSNSQPCDVCSKSLTNKAALRCESCAITVHENSCRDQVSDCTRFKVPKSIPLGSKVSSLANLTGSGHTKLQSSHSAAGGGGGGTLTTFNSNSSSSGGGSSSLYYSVSSSSAAPSSSSSANNHVTVGSSGGSTWSVAAAQSIGSNQPSSNSSTTATNTPASSSQTPSTPIASPLFGNSKCGAGADKDPSDQTLNEDQPSHATNEGDGHDTIEGVFNASDIKDLDLDPELGILDEEAEAWVGTVDKKILKKLKEKEIKRQEHIYEFIITEKHHCLTLKVMQKIFAEGMRREMRFSSETVDRIFPCLEELIEYHLQFLRRLRQRQRQESIVLTIEDILRVQFSGLLGDQLRSLYGEFCSRHQEAVSMYKEMIKEDRKFAAFARQCTMNPLCKKKGIPECILFVTQRITKYPLLIDPLIKTSREQPEECLKLQQVLGFVKDILIGVNAQVAEKERKLRLIEVYNKIDAKSATTYKNKKFKKSDLLSSNRRLMFEGVAYLNHARGKVQLVTVVVLSDVVFFLQESNQKFHFVTQDNKAGVISLQKLLVREKAGGQDTRSIYLISSNPDEPEMYELQCQNPREKRIWIDTIRAAVEQCPEDEEGNVSEGEEQRKIREAQDIKTRQLIATLREKDRQLGSLLEEKMATFCELVELLANNEDSTSSWLLLGSDSAPPKYSHLVEQGFQSAQAKETLSQAMTELCRLLGLLLSSNAAANWNLSRSVSSVGERHSDTFSMPLLPKRAETFGGFDQNGKEKGCVKKKSATDLTAVESATNEQQQPTSWSAQTPPVLQLNGDQQAMGLELVHNVSTLLCLLSSQATAFESLRNDFLAEIKASRSGTSLSSAPFGSGPATLAKFQHKASHNQRLEELRNLQDRLSKEKAEWSRERTMQEEHISEQRKQLLKLQEQVRIENTDIQQQRENLYQKLEALRGQGILLSPNMTIVSTAPMASAVSPTSGGEDADVTGASSPPPPNPPSNVATLLPSPTPSSVDLGRRKTISGGPNTAGMGSASAGLLKRESCSNLPLPMNLISAKNEQKAVVALANTLPIKQQLPMKLAKLGAAMGSSGGHATGGNSSGGGGGTISSHSSPHGNVNASPTGGGLVQQLLPLRLSESLEHKRASPKVPSSTDPFKPKLSSSSFSPPASKSEDFVAGHSRTGSSPASIQMLSPRHHHYHTTTSTTTTSSSTASAGNMHPPKIPDKPASLLLQQAARGSPQLPPPPAGHHHHHHHHHQTQPPPKVHDPETNQEIVFL